MAIRYKVVRKAKSTGYVSVLAQEEFMLLYVKGKITNAAPGSMGVLCFKRRDQAQAFMNIQGYNCCLRSPASILRVEGIGRGKVPHYFQSNFTARHIRLAIEDLAEHGWNRLFNIYLLSKPTHLGTICYNSVRVLD